MQPLDYRRAGRDASGFWPIGVKAIFERQDAPDTLDFRLVLEVQNMRRAAYILVLALVPAVLCSSVATASLAPEALAAGRRAPQSESQLAPSPALTGGAAHSRKASAHSDDYVTEFYGPAVR